MSGPLEELREAVLDPKGSIRIEHIWGGSYPYAVRVMKGAKKIGPLLFPGEGQDLSDVLKLLGEVILGTTKMVDTP